MLARHGLFSYAVMARLLLIYKFIYINISLP
jgi:hypothetical protein